MNFVLCVPALDKHVGKCDAGVPQVVDVQVALISKEAQLKTRGESYSIQDNTSKYVYEKLSKSLTYFFFSLFFQSVHIYVLKYINSFNQLYV